MGISRAPSVIIVEGLDVVAAKKNSDSGTAPMTQFCADFSRLVSTQNLKQSKVLILCTATDIERVDPNMRSPKIFAKEIEIPVPSAPARENILHKILKQVNNSLTTEEIKFIAGSTHGFVAADLRSLCNQASLDAINKQRTFDESTVCITMEHINECIKTVKPSAIKSILIDVPNVKWEDIGGQDDLKFKLKQAIEWPLKHPESFKRLGITPPKGILMYGPPGCSKTMIAKAIATESGLNFISVKGSELFSKWVGESEKAVQGIFRKARQVAPCVIFFDEIDSLGGERGTSSGSSNVHERVLAQILVEVDGIEALNDVTVVAATNRPDRIDQALLRPGRLDRIIYVPLPDANTRREILKIRFKKMPIDSKVDIDELVQSTEGYSGAELTAVCHEAALKALEEDITSEKISQSHFTQALNIVKPRITQEQIDFYENYSISRKQS
ncbi:Spermatogenesis-associated protein 5 [Orchesella cincta]|uniref:Spermatogenesis-associated protein 5 n=1 Tax=Orchesella cincta TaxID=48709 RepID=A0A1D2NCD5_ORCCI|nr:Spermatogenesis-associated protein 5 [Orchesella cincta]